MIDMGAMEELNNYENQFTKDCKDITDLIKEFHAL